MMSYIEAISKRLINYHQYIGQCIQGQINNAINNQILILYLFLLQFA